ncbi:MAG: hypothetical protein HQ522_01335 [Bacteroidetes bacterium]|nr:hypothetical protein [Bacteroidota bacterium]
MISRITSDKFRNTNKTIKEISKILKVDYILEGSGEKLNDKIKIQLQLIETATDKNLWSKPYVREITDDNILDFQDEVALLVANEINAFVTEKEKEQITNTETKNIAAYNFFLQGKNFMEIHEFTEYTNQELENKYFNYLELAQSNFQKAIQLDSTYSQAYVFMGWYYHYKSNIYIFDADKSDNYLDSALLMANKAIILHPHHADGYDLQSCIFAKKGMIKQSKKSSDKLISIDQNNWKAYYRVAENYYAMNLYSRAIRYFLMARNLNEEPLEDIRILRCLNACMIQSGFNKEAEPFLELLLNQENDSVEYYNNLSHKELSIGNADQALIYQLKAYALDTTKSQRLLQLSIINMTSKNENGMFHYFKKYLFKIQQDNLTMEPNKYAGYIYLVLGNKKESEYHFNQVLKNDIRRIELGTCNDYSYSSEYEIACIYSVKGEINKALDYLQLYKKKKSCPIWLITSLKTNPMLDNIRETSEFKKVLKDLEDKFQDEHNTTKRILINEGILQS